MKQARNRASIPNLSKQEETVHDTISHRASAPAPFDAEAFAHAVVFESDSQDRYAEELMRRIAALEEIAAARPLPA